jgi:hypothetical protein
MSGGMETMKRRIIFQEFCGVFNFFEKQDEINQIYLRENWNFFEELVKN